MTRKLKAEERELDIDSPATVASVIHTLKYYLDLDPESTLEGYWDDYVIKYKREETDEEYTKRIKALEKRKATLEKKRQADKELEKKEYLRLKAKFEGKT